MTVWSSRSRSTRWSAGFDAAFRRRPIDPLDWSVVISRVTLFSMTAIQPIAGGDSRWANLTNPPHDGRRTCTLTPDVVQRRAAQEKQQSCAARSTRQRCWAVTPGFRPPKAQSAERSSPSEQKESPSRWTVRWFEYHRATSTPSRRSDPARPANRFGSDGRLIPAEDAGASDRRWWMDTRPDCRFQFKCGYLGVVTDRSFR